MRSVTLRRRPPLPYDEASAYLAAREAGNRQRVLSIDLLGELDTSVEELEELGDAIATLMTVRGPEGAFREFERKYPIAFADFLVAAGIHHYQKGEYWPWLYDRVDLPRQNHPTRWGELFEHIIDTYHLEQFSALREERATRFVAKFLAHGGIPTYCLSDFFQLLLVPAVQSGEHRELRPSELIRSWDSRASAFVHVDKPVRRFLVHGGNVARDFLGRCLEMAEIGLSGHALPEAKELGLPSRIVETFDTWLKTAPRSARLTNAGTTRRYSKPALTYDPWAPDALNLSLPSEPIGASDRNIVWSVSAGPWSRRVDVTPHRADRKTTRAAELRLTSPFAVVDVALEIDGEQARSWRFSGITPTMPFLVFREGTGELVDVADPLEFDAYWLIAPREADLSVARGGHSDPLNVIEELPLLAGGWSRYKGLYADLAGYSRLHVTLGGDRVDVPLRRINTSEEHVHLTGGTPVSLPLILNGQQAYEGTPPTLILPLPARGNEKQPANRWRMHISSSPGAEPRMDTRFSGDDGLLAVIRDTGQIAIDLANRDLLGPHPIGEFRISARGPLGLDADFTLVLLPRLAIQGLRDVLTPDEDGPPSARVRVRTSAYIHAQDPSITVRELSPGEHEVVAPGHLDRIPLTVSSTRQGGKEGAADLSLPLRRLRWAISGLTDHLPEVTDHPLTVGRDELEQAYAPALIVDVPNADSSTLIAAQIEDQAGRCLHRFSERRVDQSHRFSLREALDTIRARSDARLYLVVLVRDAQSGWPPRRAVVAHLTRSLHISDFALRSELVGSHREITVTWTEALPVTNRVLRLWPLWRLWEERPLEISVPDTSGGSHTFCVERSVLPPGGYRIELAISDPWLAPAPLEMADLKSGNCADVYLGEDQEVQDYLRALPTDEPLGILERFLATRDPRALTRLDETLDAEEVPSAVRAALGFIDIVEAGALQDESALREAMAALQPALLGRRETILAIAHLSGSGAAVEHRLRRLIVELGILRADGQLALQSLSFSDRNRLWNLWAPLLLAIDGKALVEEDSPVIEASKNILGIDVSPWLFNHEQDSVTPRVGIDVTSIRFQGQELTYEASRLQWMRESLSLLPSGPLDADSWMLANFDWLIRLNEDAGAERRAHEWVSGCLSAAQADIAVLRRLLPFAATHVADRWPTVNVSPLSFLPYLVGATALVERATARGVLASSGLMQEASRGYHSPREAFAAAVELYTRDLCLMDLLILHARKTGVIGDHRA